MVAIDRRVIQNFDWFSFGLILLMSIVGILTIYSATRPIAGEVSTHYYLKQTFWLGIALVALFLFVSFDYSLLGRFSPALFIFGILSLVLVLLVGKSGVGAKRWIQLGPLNVQPSEFFKIFFIVMLTYHLSQIRGKLQMRDIIKAVLLYLLLPIALIIKEPDLGSSMILLLLFVIIIFIRGIYRKALIILIAVSIISLPFLGGIVWSKLKPYQKNRIIAFVKPQIDPSGIGYQIEQSKITVGSGRFVGKGYLKGTQGPFRFLPENHTDFIFSIFAEEWGFLGSCILLAIYLLFLLRGVDTALRAKDPFGRLLSFSIVGMFFIYFMVNVGMTLGLMPIVGIPLPFLSYGGTSLVSNFAAVGILINVRMRRFALFY